MGHYVSRCVASRLCAVPATGLFARLVSSVVVREPQPSKPPALSTRDTAAPLLNAVVRLTDFGGVRRSLRAREPGTDQLSAVAMRVILEDARGHRPELVARGRFQPKLTDAQRWAGTGRRHPVGTTTHSRPCTCRVPCSLMTAVTPVVVPCVSGCCASTVCTTPPGCSMDRSTRSSKLVVTRRAPARPARATARCTDPGLAWSKARGPPERHRRSPTATPWPPQT